jgi:hypothetical protein
MSNLASSAVQVTGRWLEPIAQSGKPRHAMRAIVTLTGQGGTSNKVLATAFGLSEIEQNTTFIKSDNSKVYLGAPSADGSFLLLIDLTITGDSTIEVPVDVTGTLIGIVKGYV